MRHARRGLGVVALAVALIAAVAAATARLFVWPETTGASRADAVVVLGASADERLARGLELADQGVAPNLVLSASDPDSELCPRGVRRFRRGPVHGLCVTPRPYTTQGEGETIGRLADKRGWRVLVLVTSTYHVTRARLLLDRCFDGRIETVSANPHAGAARQTEEILHEWGGLVYALLVARGC